MYIHVQQQFQDFQNKRKKITQFQHEFYFWRQESYCDTRYFDMEFMNLKTIQKPRKERQKDDTEHKFIAVKLLVIINGRSHRYKNKQTNNQSNKQIIPLQAQTSSLRIIAVICSRWIE
jgi:hypothetical protein